MAEGFQTPGRDPSEYRKRSAEAERMHPLDVPGHGDEAPLAADAIEPAQQKLAESHHRFDDAEHRLRGLLAQSVELFALRCPRRQAMASTGVGFSGAGGGAANRSRQEG